MEVTDEVVKNVAALTQLKVEGDEIRQLAAGMKNILDLAEQMQTADTSDVEPMSNPLDAIQQLRPDVVTEVDEHELFQSIAPATEEGLYLVPRVVE